MRKDYYFITENKLDNYLTNKCESDTIHNINKRRADNINAYEHGYVATLSKEYYCGKEKER